MKNLLKLSFPVLFAIMVSPAFSQLSVGPRLGVNFSTWVASEDLELDLKSRASILFGVVAEVRISENFAVQPELDFIQKGFSSEEVTTGSSSGHTDLIINHIEIPILAKFGKDFGPARVDVLIGPSFSYGLNGKFKTTFTVNGDTTVDTDEIDFEEDEFSRSDLSLQIGAAASKKLGETANVFFDIRYLLGLTNINNSGSDDEAHNRIFAISIGALFAL